MKKPARQEEGQFARTLSLATAARRLGVRQQELRRRLGLGEYPFVQIRGRIRVPARALHAEDEAASRPAPPR